MDTEAQKENMIATMIMIAPTAVFTLRPVNAAIQPLQSTHITTD